LTGSASTTTRPRPWTGCTRGYPGKFFFCSETSSEESTRGVYQDPQLLNTGENYTPGKRATSSYDNNLASWTMSGEYELKKDRDREFWAGGFLWSGQDYIGEPTPYDVFPVKASFFGAIDTAGFPKDFYHLFKSQVDQGSDGAHPADELDRLHPRPGCRGLGLRQRRHGGTIPERQVARREIVRSEGHHLRAQVPGDDRAHGDDYNYPSGSYTSPNGSTGKLHLTWSVPFQPGRLTAVATQNGRVVARDEIHTAGEPRALTLTPDTQEIAADGKSLSFLTVEVTDHDGVVVPDASHLIKFRVEGPGTLAGVDNGQQENAQSYQAPSVPAFNGKALVVVRSTRQAGHITVTASSPGLGRASATLRSAAAGDQGAAVISSVSAGAAAGAPAALTADAASPATPMADASYSGAPDTLPAAMLDGDLTTGWSNYYNKSGTANLHAVSVSRASDWVSVSWPDRQEFSAITVFSRSALR